MERSFHLVKTQLDTCNVQTAGSNAVPASLLRLLRTGRRGSGHCCSHQRRQRLGGSCSRGSQRTKDRLCVGNNVALLASHGCLLSQQCGVGRCHRSPPYPRCIPAAVCCSRCACSGCAPACCRCRWLLLLRLLLLLLLQVCCNVLQLALNVRLLQPQRRQMSVVMLRIKRGSGTTFPAAVVQAGAPSIPAQPRRHPAKVPPCSPAS